MSGRRGRRKTAPHRLAYRCCACLSPFCADSPPDEAAAVAASGCSSVIRCRSWRRRAPARLQRGQGAALRWSGVCKPAGIALLVAQGNTTPSALFRHRLAEPDRKHAKLFTNGSPCKAHRARYGCPLYEGHPEVHAAPARRFSPHPDAEPDGTGRNRMTPGGTGRNRAESGGLRRRHGTGRRIPLPPGTCAAGRQCFRDGG